MNWRKTIFTLGHAAVAGILSFLNAYLAVLLSLPEGSAMADMPQIPVVAAGIGASISFFKDILSFLSDSRSM